MKIDPTFVINKPNLEVIGLSAQLIVKSDLRKPDL